MKILHSIFISLITPTTTPYFLLCGIKIMQHFLNANFVTELYCGYFHRLI